MPFVDPLRSSQTRPGHRAAQAVLARASLCLAVALVATACTQQGADQSNASNTPKPSASAPYTNPVLATAVPTSGPKWQDLTKDQQRILKPLTSIWETLGSINKSKWIAITSSYAKRSAAEQQRMQERMAEWAALTPSERERARLNFAETKKLAPTERAADWEAYQGLSAQEKKAFAKAAPVKPVGAAVAVVPTSPDKLTAVPVTRRTPANDESTTLIVRPLLNPKTLLPAPVIPQESSPAPATESGAAAEGASENVAPDRRLTIN